MSEQKKQREYLAIDLKSFYASVECVERSLDPLCTNLVVADESRSDKTICLAVSPSLKAYGIPGRPRLFEVKQKVKEINWQRQAHAPGNQLGKESVDAMELNADPTLALGFIAAVPRMATYMEYSRRIYGIYLRYIAPEDIHVYSIDEVFIDVTDYRSLYRKSGAEIAGLLIREVMDETGITATAGVGTNLYLAKVAMDIVAKHIPPDEKGVRIAQLDEMSYRRLLWAHEPLTDFWRIGKGIARRLNAMGIYTMGDICRKALKDEGALYQEFGVNAEFLIDHAFGEESALISDIQAYEPENRSIASGQVLSEGYPYEKAKIIVREMSESLADDLLARGLASDCFVLYVGYDVESLKQPGFHGATMTDWYGRTVPRSSGGTAHLERQTNSARKITDAILRLFEKTADRSLLVRRFNLTAANVTAETEVRPKQAEQLDLFGSFEVQRAAEEAEEQTLKKERRARKAILEVRRRFGKNAVVKATSLEEGATGMERNRQIGGHKA